MYAAVELQDRRIRLPFELGDKSYLAIRSVRGPELTLISGYQWQQMRRKLGMLAQSYLASRGGAADVRDGNMFFDDQTLRHIGDGPFFIARDQEKIRLKPLTDAEAFQFYTSEPEIYQNSA